MARNKTKFTAESGKQEFFVTREFDAPRELVFKAFTDPNLYVQWLGPRKYKMRLEKFEPRSGGMWRYTHSDEKGNAFGFHGVNHEVLPPERLIDTFQSGMEQGMNESFERLDELLAKTSVPIVSR